MDAYPTLAAGASYRIPNSDPTKQVVIRRLMISVSTATLDTWTLASGSGITNGGPSVSISIAITDNNRTMQEIVFPQGHYVTLTAGAIAGNAQIDYYYK